MAGVTCGIDAGENGVGLWESGASGSDCGGFGRQFSWSEWYDTGCAYLNAPDGTTARIDDLARKLGIAVPAAETARPITKREDLEIEEPSPEERRDSRLARLFPKG